MNELEIVTRQADDVRLLYPKGFINAHTARHFEDEIQRALREGCCKIVVNGAELAYVASAGLGAMMGLIEEIRGRGGDLRLSELNETVRNIFEILGFHHLYRIFPTEVEALGSFREAGGAGGTT